MTDIYILSNGCRHWDNNIQDSYSVTILHKHIFSLNYLYDGAILQRERNKRIGPKVKQVPNVDKHVLHKFLVLVINTTAYHLRQYSLHLLLLKKSFMPIQVLDIEKTNFHFIASKSQPFLSIFVLFLSQFKFNLKRLDVLGNQTRGRRMVVTDGSPEL